MDKLTPETLRERTLGMGTAGVVNEKAVNKEQLQDTEPWLKVKPGAEIIIGDKEEEIAITKTEVDGYLAESNFREANIAIKSAGMGQQPYNPIAQNTLSGYGLVEQELIDPLKNIRNFYTSLIQDCELKKKQEDESFFGRAEFELNGSTYSIRFNGRKYNHNSSEDLKYNLKPERFYKLEILTQISIYDYLTSVGVTGISEELKTIYCYKEFIINSTGRNNGEKESALEGAKYNPLFVTVSVHCDLEVSDLLEAKYPDVLAKFAELQKKNESLIYSQFSYLEVTRNLISDQFPTSQDIKVLGDITQNATNASINASSFESQTMTVTYGPSYRTNRVHWTLFLREILSRLDEVTEKEINIVTRDNFIKILGSLNMILGKGTSLTSLSMIYTSGAIKFIYDFLAMRENRDLLDNEIVNDFFTHSGLRNPKQQNTELDIK